MKLAAPINVWDGREILQTANESHSSLTGAIFSSASLVTTKGEANRYKCY
jgi:hypothetical protein